MYTIIVRHKAAKYLQKLPEGQRARIRKALDQLSEDPLAVTGVKAMLGEWRGTEGSR